MGCEPEVGGEETESNMLEPQDDSTITTTTNLVCMCLHVCESMDITRYGSTLYTGLHRVFPYSTILKENPMFTFSFNLIQHLLISR